MSTKKNKAESKEIHQKICNVSSIKGRESRAVCGSKKVAIFVFGKVCGGVLSYVDMYGGQSLFPNAICLCVCF